jgi:hypothetical protein
VARSGDEPAEVPGGEPLPNPRWILPCVLGHGDYEGQNLTWRGKASVSPEAVREQAAERLGSANA